MSPMRLRNSIRVPVRYGEDDPDTPRHTSLRPSKEDALDEDYKETGASGNLRPRKKRRPNHVQYDPSLPPAAFPSLNTANLSTFPRTSQPASRAHKVPESPKANGAILLPRTPSPGRNEPRKPDSLASSELGDVPIDQLENHLASNTMANPTYGRNVKLAYMPRPGPPLSPDDMRGRLDSDDDQLPDATQVLLEKIPNPSWNDLNPAMQVEIFENMMGDYTHSGLCRVLGLEKEEHDKLAQYRGIRNKQILRENNHLEEMRAKQRRVLMNIDNSDLKVFEPPPQLVLKRILRNSTGKLINKHGNLMMCQSHDVLKARQYLHRRGLPRHYAGNWGDSLVVLKESEPADPRPDKFEWEEELEFTPPPLPEDPRRAHAPQANVDFLDNFGKGVIAPSSLVRCSTDQNSTPNWGKYYGRRKQDLSWDTAKPRMDGIVKLKLGPRRAAAFQEYQRTGIMPQEFRPLGNSNQRFKYRAPIPQGDLSQPSRSQLVRPRVVMPPVAIAHGLMPQFAMPSNSALQDTMGDGVVGHPQGAQIQCLMPQVMPARGQVSPPDLHSPLMRESRKIHPSRAIQGDTTPLNSSVGITPGFNFAHQPARPISRRLSTDYYPSTPMEYSRSQARYQQQIMLAYREHVEAIAKAEAERVDCRPPHQASTVGVGTPLSRGSVQKITGTAVDPFASDTFSWKEHEERMRAEALHNMAEQPINPNLLRDTKDKKSSESADRKFTEPPITRSSCHSAHSK